MTVLHTYAMLNENDICYGFTKLAKKFTKENTSPSMVWIPDKNGLLIKNTNNPKRLTPSTNTDPTAQYLMKRSFIVPNCGVPIFNFSRFTIL